MAGRGKVVHKLQMAMFVVGNPCEKKGGRAVYMMEDELCITQADITDGPERTLVVYCKKGYSPANTMACFLGDEDYTFEAAADEAGRYAAKFDGESFTFYRDQVEVGPADAAWCAEAHLKNVYVMDDFDKERTVPRRTQPLKYKNRVTFDALSDPEHGNTLALVHLMSNLPSAAELRAASGKARAAKRPYEAEGSATAAAAASQREIGRNEGFAQAYRDLMALKMAEAEAEKQTAIAEQAKAAAEQAKAIAEQERARTARMQLRLQGGAGDADAGGDAAAVGGGDQDAV